MKTLLLVLPVWLLAVGALAQDSVEVSADLQQFTDEHVGYQDDGNNYEELYENHIQLLSSRYDLNKVSAEELKFLNILTDRQIYDLLEYRTAQGRLLDVYELQVIPGFDVALIKMLLPFVKVVDPLSRVDQSLFRRIFSGNHSYLIARYARTLEQKKGFIQSPGHAPSYQGSPDNLYFRFRTALAGDFSIGITGEKDAGEKVMLDPGDHQWGFDFTSLHVQLQNKGKLKNIIAGDFQTQFAQGLLLGGAFGLGKGGESVSTTRKSNLGFLPYTSRNENAYHRGAGFTLQPLESILISAFYSRARRDASIDAESDTVSSFLATGYHRTAGELTKRKKALEQSYGMVLQFVRRKLDAGMIIHSVHFDMPVKRKSTRYNQDAFSGSKNLNTGFFISYNLQNVSFFTEVGQSWRGGRAGIAGLLMSPHPKFELALLYRNYMRNFYSFYSNAFSEGTQPQNEHGVYWGWKYQWNRQHSFRGYVDLFTFPWLGFRRYAPSDGYEWMIRTDYKPTKNIFLFIQVREERKQRNSSRPQTLYQLGIGQKRNVTINCDYGVGEKIRLKSRLQYNRYKFDSKTTNGFALLQDISFSAGRFKFTGRHALFDTDHYDNRHYVYEHDVWLAYSLPAYSGTGVRNYALIEYKVHKQLTLWVRYARTRLTHSEEIGSGSDIIEGNTRNDIKFQARFKF